MRRAYLIAVCICFLCGCRPYTPAPENSAQREETLAEVSIEETDAEEAAAKNAKPELIQPETASLELIQPETTKEISVHDTREAIKVKGIYLSAYVAGSPDRMNAILENIENSQINAVVIDVKDDEGRVTFSMDSPVVTEIEASKKYIGDMKGLMEELKSRDLYVIARVVAFKDPYLAEKKPEWSLKTASGERYRDKDGLAWVDPYRREVWDYLVEIGSAAGEYGFDEVQFDYIRFATDKTMNQVVFDENEVKGRSKTDIITEFTQYAYDKLTEKGLFVSADVFGAIIGSEEDAGSVGQIYGDMAANLDYICPMIYPSHYGDGNFGIQYPDTKPYETIAGALSGSKEDLAAAGDQERQAIVRPWLQDFTASYLKNHIKYGPDEVRAQIKAVYDSGYEEWILWNASNRYSWDGLTKE